jgi:hypothetical protein
MVLMGKMVNKDHLGLLDLKAMLANGERLAPQDQLALLDQWAKQDQWDQQEWMDFPENEG